MADELSTVSAAARKALKVYDTWAEMKADTVSVAEGDRLMVGGYCLDVAATAATDHHTTRTDGVKLYSAEQYLPSQMFGIVADGTTDNSDNAMVVAMNTAAASGLPLVWEAGTVYSTRPDGNVFVSCELTRGQKLKMLSEARTTFNFPNLAVQAPTAFLSTTLSADVAQGDLYIDVASVTDVEVGDLIHIDTDVSVETGWGYHKQCLRRVMSIDGTRVYLDQPMDFWFLTSETGAAVKFIEPAEVEIENIDFIQGNQAANTYRRLSRGRINNCSWTGPVRGWQSVYSDSITIVDCNDFVFDNFKIDKSRYSPMALNSRFITFRNGTVMRTRHMDFNTWCQDVVIENTVGYDTDGILQTHPTIRPTFRNVHDLTNRINLHGFDMRAVGDIVENCSSASTQGDGFNTNRCVLKAEYEDWAQTFTRHYKDLRIANARVTGGNNGLFICENVHAYEILEGEGTAYVDGASTTRVKGTLRTAYDGEYFNQITLLDDYRRVDGVTSGTITGATQASPVVITETAHGRTNGDLVYINDVAGMTELNVNPLKGTQTGRVYKIASATTDTYALTDPSDDSNIDGTGFTAYTSGGTATSAEASQFATITELQVGRLRPNWRLRGNIFSGDINGATSFTYPVHVNAAGNDGRVQFNANNRHFRLRLRAFSNEGWSEAVYAGMYYPLGGSSLRWLSAKESTHPDPVGVSVSAANFYCHMRDDLIEEGIRSSGDYTDDDELWRYYIAFDVTATLPATNDALYKVEMEWEEW